MGVPRVFLRRRCATSRTSPGTLARHLIDNPDLKELELEIRKRVRLEGRELEDHKFRAKEKAVLLGS